MLVLRAAVCLTLLAVLSAKNATAQDSTPLSAAVVVSQKIRPYMDALEGIQATLETEAGTRPEIFFMEPEKDPENLLLTERLQRSSFDVFLAVGPEATAFVWSVFPEGRTLKVFSMVLNPEKIVSGQALLCGVPLNIPVPVQVMEFSRKLPRIKRIGLIYDPANNAEFAAEAVRSARGQGIEIIPLKVTDRSDILSVLTNQWKSISALWVIPDRTVISESLILFMIKEAIANNVAVLGFNRFFTDSGAGLALACDYQGIGRQAARLALAKQSGNPCGLEAPAYQVLLNVQVLETLGIAYTLDKPMETGERKP